MEFTYQSLYNTNTRDTIILRQQLRVKVIYYIVRGNLSISGEVCCLKTMVLPTRGESDGSTKSSKDEDRIEAFFIYIHSFF